jgi:hypothetical protein
MPQSSHCHPDLFALDEPPLRTKLLPLVSALEASRLARNGVTGNVDRVLRPGRHRQHKVGRWTIAQRIEPPYDGGGGVASRDAPLSRSIGRKLSNYAKFLKAHDNSVIQINDR